MNGKIYLITNLVNGKQYVGKTIGDVRHRFNEHVSDAISGRGDTDSVRAIFVRMVAGLSVYPFCDQASDHILS